MNETEKEAWQTFQSEVNGFLGNKNDPIYKELVEKFTLQKRGLSHVCKTSLFMLSSGFLLKKSW